jgi:hypothetical protein
MIVCEVRIFALFESLHAPWELLVDSGTVDIRFGDAADDLRPLARSLCGEDEFRGRVDFVEAAPVPGHMGGFADTLTVIVTSGTATTLVSSLFAWFNRRRESRNVSLKLHNADGRELELKCGSSDDAEKVLTQVGQFFGAGA